MPRHGTRLTSTGSRPIAFRIPNEMADAIEAALGPGGLGEWGRQAFALALRGGKAAGSGEASIEGFAEGRRQGWAHANKVFREALGEAVKRLK